MERHPYAFLTIVVLLGAMSGAQLMMLWWLHQRLPAVLHILKIIRNNTDELTDRSMDRGTGQLDPDTIRAGEADPGAASAQPT